MNHQSTMTVTVSRRFKASAERVFDAWLDPQKARHFLFTHGAQYVVRADIDARVGGSFIFVARRDGKDVDHIGEYLEIDRPGRLVFTLLVPAVWSQKNRVAIDIVALQTGCELTLTHDGVLSQHEGTIFNGWTAFLQGLQSTQFDPKHDEIGAYQGAKASASR